MKIIGYLKDLFECIRLSRENARLKEIIRHESGEEKLKEIEAEIEKQWPNFSKLKKQK